MPRWSQSIRFRLSLAYALAVFATGAVLLLAVYLRQAHQLNRSIVVTGQTVSAINTRTGIQLDFRYFGSDELVMSYFELVERETERQSLREFRNASLPGLGVLAIAAFASGWLLAGWTLSPMGRMAAVAREISGTELSRRINMHGPDDELKDLADTFDEMLDRLQGSFEDHRRFVQDASHELRNPLAATQTNLELVLDDSEAGVEELRDAARIAHASACRVGRIVDELVDQARQGVPTISKSVVELRWLAGDIATELAATASARELTIDLGDGPEKVEVKGEQAALRRAITNLVVNAVRLAPPRTSVGIRVGLAGEATAYVSVTDEGPGIAPSEQKVIFERFQQGKAGGKGLGLGLSIVRQVIERHGGRVELESELGVGSTFTLYLPMPVTH